MEGWTHHDILVDGSYVTVPDLPGNEGHRWFSETVLDGLLPIWAPVGMYFSPIKGNIKPEITVRNNTFIETPLSMMAAMRGIIFTGLHSSRAQVILNGPEFSGVTGVLYWDTMPIYEFGSPNIRVTALTTEPYFATATKAVSVTFYAVMTRGYRTMADNSDLISRSELDQAMKATIKPLASEHTLNNFLRVAAVPEGGRIRVLYRNGLTPALLQQIWEEAKLYAPA